jgi:peptidoglycan/xylan/chitin deacetylase (PgdA/CDA1 family)
MPITGSPNRCLRAIARPWASFSQKAGWTAVVFHNIGHDDDSSNVFVNGLGVTMQRDVFNDCIRYLARKYDIVSLPDMLSQIAGNSARVTNSGRRKLLISFDDAYASVAHIAAPVLADVGIPWCFFLNPTLVGNSMLAADNAVSYIANTYSLEPLSQAARRPVSSVRDFIQSEFTIRTPTQRRTLICGLLDGVGADANKLAQDAKLYVESEDVRRLAESGVAIGNHTADHVYCRTLDADSLRQQVVDSARAIEELSGRPVSGFAYPYGSQLDRSAQMTTALRASGHECAFLVHNRLNTSRTDTWGLYRVSLTSGDPRAVAVALEIRPRIRAATAKPRAALARRLKERLNHH